MLLRLKSRMGAFLIVAGGLIAVLGEIFNLWNTNPTTGGWLVSMGLVALGAVVLVYGINQYAQLSDTIDLVGLLGAGLLFLGGLLMIIGIIAVNMVVLPMLLGMAATIAAAINAPGAAAQGATNTVSSGINTVTNGVAGLFGQSGGSIPSVTVPGVNGVDIVNKTLAGLHLPSLASISLWGQFFFSGAPLTLGCLLLGWALLRTKGQLRTTGLLLIIAAVINLIGQLLIRLVPVMANVTGILLFLALSWLGVSILFPKIAKRISFNIPLLAAR